MINKLGLNWITMNTMESLVSCKQSDEPHATPNIFLNRKD
jgi:hypothetical protein